MPSFRDALACGVVAAFASSAGPSAAQTEEVTVHGDASGDFSSRADERSAAREVTDAASLVEPLPGVHLRRYGADDSFTTLSVRGSSSTQVAIVFAGVPLSGGADPSLDLSSLPLWPGAVARVHRTFAPAALGPGSLGGTLVLDPPRPTSPASTDVWAALGSLGEARLRVGDVRDAGGGARVATAVSASRADGSFSVLDPRLSSPGQDVYSSRQNAGHTAVDGLVSWALPVRWSAGSEGTLSVTTLAQSRHQQLPGTLLDPTLLASLDSDRELAAVEVTGSAGPGAWIARTWGRREGLRLSDPDSSAALGPTRADQTVSAAGGSAGWRGRPTSSSTIEARLDGSEEGFAPGTWAGTAVPPGATRASAGVGLDAAWHALEALTLAGSGRIDGWSNASDGATAGDLRPTGHIGMESTILDGVTLAAHGGATARPPSFVELYGDRGAFLGNRSLASESAWSVDAGVRAARRLGPARVALEVDGFWTRAQDLITFVPIGAYRQLEATNIGLARLLGIEVDLRAVLGPVELRGSYTGLLTENDSGPPSCQPVVGPCQAPPLPGRPTNDLVADGIVAFGPASVRAGVDAVTGMTSDVSGSIGVPPRVLTSAGARVDVAEGVRLALDVRNLLDVRTGTYAGALGPVREPIGDYYQYPLPGRTILVSVRFTQPAERR
jgi:hypothetical protein